MANGTGRHRRRRSGWASRLRWTVGAMLCAIVGATSAPRRPQRQDEKRPRPVPRAAPSAPAAEHREPAWVRRYDQARREHADRARELYTERPAVATVERLPKTGWCEDEAGGRAVRPYLVAHEQRQRASRGDLLAPPTSRDVTAPRIPVT